MSKAYSYYYRDDWVNDLQELVSLDLTESNVQVETNVSTTNFIVDGMIQSSDNRQCITMPKHHHKYMLTM
jgi:hypothetical protein